MAVQHLVPYSLPLPIYKWERERKSSITEWGEMLWELLEKKEKNTRKTQSSMDMAERSRDLAGSLESKERGRKFFGLLQGIVLEMDVGILQLMAVMDILRHVNGSIPLCCAEWAEREVSVVEIVHGRCKLCRINPPSVCTYTNLWCAEIRACVWRGADQYYKLTISGVSCFLLPFCVCVNFTNSMFCLGLI